MENVLLAGLGGFIGTVFRFLLNNLVYHYLPSTSFPYGTLVVNVLGCLIIGFLNGLADNRGMFTADLRIFIFIGILGGFTTFSSFGYDTFGLARSGQLWLAGLNIFLQIFLGLSAVILGYISTRLL